MFRAAQRECGVPRVDPQDDTIRRFVVRLYAFDSSRRERRHQEIAAFDNESEAMACMGETHRALLERRETGEAHPRDHVTIGVKQPGDAERNRERRLAGRRFRHRS
jgi:hypothetical protein